MSLSNWRVAVRRKANKFFHLLNMCKRTELNLIGDAFVYLIYLHFTSEYHSSTLVPFFPFLLSNCLYTITLFYDRLKLRSILYNL